MDGIGELAVVTAFRINVPDAELDDLRDRLRRTRWPERETAEGWAQGVPLTYLRDLCRYWAEDYDWRSREAWLNSFPHFREEIDGLGIHFLHVRSTRDDALPLVITHGWPGSVVEFLKVIPLLTDEFHVVCPSLPGYGFSDKPPTTGWGVARIADAWDVLMGRLGYKRYGAAGGDWGAAVTRTLATNHAGHLVGIHLNMVIAQPDQTTFGELTESERAGLADMKRFNEQDSAYSRLQATRPQTIGYALVDSPVGQCAWILEKFWSWSDCDGDPLNSFSRDELLDNVMFYWLTGSGASSARLYWESLSAGPASVHEAPVDVPVGCSIYPREIFRPSRRWAEKSLLDIRWWDELPKGGHFAAFEHPELYADQLKSFFRLAR